MTTELLEKLTRGQHLVREEAGTLMRAIMSGQLSDPQIAGVLVALRAKGETVEEIAGFVGTMRQQSRTIQVRDNCAVDTCGTGGDAPSTFNISTATALVAAGMGITIAKHGNRAVSSSCGSADVLEALEVNLELRPDQVAQVIDRVGIGFLFAPSFHPAMKHAAGARRALGLRTVFNLLGPLTNPSGVKRQLIGVYNRDLTETVAWVLETLGSERVYAVHGYDGSDELSICGPTWISELKEGRVRSFSFTPESVGLTLAEPHQIVGGDIKQNAETINKILAGARGPCRDVVVLNGAFTAMAAGRAESVEHGLNLAAESIDSGKARAKLDDLVRTTREIAAADRKSA